MQLAAGLRTYFDKALRHLLLYDEERALSSQVRHIYIYLYIQHIYTDMGLHHRRLRALSPSSLRPETACVIVERGIQVAACAALTDRRHGSMSVLMRRPFACKAAVLQSAHSPRCTCRQSPMQFDLVRSVVNCIPKPQNCKVWRTSVRSEGPF